MTDSKNIQALRTNKRELPFPLVFIFLILSLIVIIAGYSYHNNYKKAALDHTRAELASVCNLKVNDIVQWRKERFKEAFYISNNLFRGSQIHTFLNDPATTAIKKELTTYLLMNKDAYEHKEVAVFDLKGKVVLSTIEPVNNYDQHIELANKAIETKEIIFGDLHRDEKNGEIHIGLFIPMFTSKEKNRHPIGGIMLLLDPNKFLYPLIKTWPVPSKTSETVLLRQDGNDALYLNDLNNMKNTALSLRLPLTQDEVPAVQAVKGKEGFIEGVDYRNVPVLTFNRRIPETPWVLISKTDLSEAYKPINRSSLNTMAFVIVAILSTGLGISLYSRNKKAAFYSSIFHELKTTAFVIDPSDGRIIDANIAASTFYGWSIEELTKMKISDINTLGADKVHEEMESARTQNRNYFVFQHRMADGSVKDVEVYSGPIQTDGKTLLYSIIHDVTDRKTFENRLAQLMHEQRIILDNLAIGVLFAKDRKIVWANNVLAEMFGYTEAELIGEDTKRFYADNDEYMTIGLEGYAKLAEGEVYKEECLMKKRDGTFISCRLIAQAINAENLSEGSIWLLEDITERKILETEREQFFKFFVTSADLMLIADPNGAFIRTNPACTETLGYSEAELVSKPFIDFVHPDDKQATLDEMARQLRKGFTLNFENRYICKDGSLRWLSWRAAYNITEGITYATARDVTELKTMQAALHRRTLQLEDLAESLEKRVREEVEERRRNEHILIQQSKMAAMGEMIGAIAHQWRQPLNVLGLLVQSIGDLYDYGELNKQRITEVVNKSMGQIRFMSRTIDDFRNFFSPSKDKTEFDLSLAVADVLTLVAAQLKEHNITTKLNGKPFVDTRDSVACGELMVTTYKNEFEQVILNIINNAKDAIMEKRNNLQGELLYNYNGAIEVTLSKEQERTVIRIEDNGGGIPEGTMNRIFEPYFTTKPEGKGTGIGLYMAKIIIEKNIGGKLSVKNTGKGAEFTIEV
ncbi:MAG: PAS domain-containing sensor histidine kinase [Nitrospirae bacterium]|nr:MAG: PAS domain-containing sensor histidine kinase [Nitrospirota bacterium]